MSRSKPTEGVRNPSSRWFEWAGGNDGGYVRWYDKEAKHNVKVEGAFVFMLLDELSTIKGWHDPSESGIYANEVHSMMAEPLNVRAFKGGDLISGFYTNIKDRVKAIGGHYCVSLYLAFKDGADLKIGNLTLKGAAAGAWMEFKKNVPAKKDENGKAIRGYFVDAIKIAGFEELKKGATVYRVPKFALLPTSEETNKQALVLDIELQEYLAGYAAKAPATETASPAAPPADEPPTTDDDVPPELGDDDIPW